MLLFNLAQRASKSVDCCPKMGRRNFVKKHLLTLIRVACQPLPKEGLVVFKTPTRGRRGGARLFTTKTLDFESSVKVKF